MTETKAHYRTRKSPPPPSPIAELRLIQFDAKRRILAGHDGDDGDYVFVLRKEDGDRWRLYRLAITEADQALRSFVSADDSEAAELMAAIAETMAKPKRKTRKRKAR